VSEIRKNFGYFITVLGSSYAVIWALLEPSGLFGLDERFRELGIAGYMILLAPSLLIAIIATAWRVAKSNSQASTQKVKRQRSSVATLIHDNYSIVKTINESNESSIYKASDPKGDFYIIKKTLSSLCSVAAQNTLKRISHPHISSPTDIWEEEGYLYEIIPYVEGKRVSELLEESDYGLQGAFLSKYIDELAEAVKMLHKYEIIHRDINPDNVLFSLPEKKFVLIDSTFAVKISDPKQSPIGRVGYSDKYQLSGKAGVSTDLYSLGATLYFSAYRKRLPPFEERVVHPQKIGFPSVSDKDALPKAVEKLLSTIVKDRFKDAGEFLEYIRPRRVVTQAQSFSGMICLPDTTYILMGWLSTEYLDRRSFVKFARKPPPGITTDFRSYLKSYLERL